MPDLLRNALATKRIVRLVVHDKITEDLRVKLFDKFPPEDHWFSYVLTCMSCAPVWVAGLVVSKALPDFLLDLLAASEVATLLDEGARRWGSSI